MVIALRSLTPDLSQPVFRAQPPISASAVAVIETLEERIKRLLIQTVANLFKLGLTFILEYEILPEVN